jgi:hypothetical protein
MVATPYRLVSDYDSPPLLRKIFKPEEERKHQYTGNEHVMRNFLVCSFY